jgi:hypothetical protein
MSLSHFRCVVKTHCERHLGEGLFVFVHKPSQQDLQTPVSYILVYGVTWKLWCICSKITSCVPSDTVNKLYQGVLNCQNTTWFYDIPEVNATLFTHMRKLWPSLSRFWRNPLLLDSISADLFTEFYPNRKQMWKEKLKVYLRSEVKCVFF